MYTPSNRNFGDAIAVQDFLSDVHPRTKILAPLLCSTVYGNMNLLILSILMTLSTILESEKLGKFNYITNFLIYTL